MSAPFSSEISSEISAEGARLDAFRGRFPILERKTYLASHSLGAVPRAAADSLAKYFDEWATLGIEAWDGPWWDSILEFCALIERALGAAPGTVVPMENATRGMAAVASALTILPARNRVVMTDLEFITSYPFWRGLEARGAEIVIVESEGEQRGISVPAERLCAAIDERTLIVATGHVYFRSGAVQDLSRVAEKCRQVGAYSLGDGYQSVGTVPVDVTALGLDFYVGGSHKWLCGGPGAGYLYVRPELIPRLEPRLTGWFGAQDPFKYRSGTRYPLAQGVFRFLAGTPALPAIYAAREGIRAVLEAGLPAIRRRSIQLTEHIIREADARGLQVRSPRQTEERSGMVCLEFPDSEAATRQLSRSGVVVDWRPHCGIRVSPHFYNRPDEIGIFFRELDRCRS